MEATLRRLEGVENISISIRKQEFQITYKPESSFQPQDIRDAVGKADVSVIQFRIAARGRVQEEGGKRFFIAGKSRFLLLNSPNIPTDSPVSILGTVDDSTNPLTLKVVEFNTSKP